MAKVVVAMCMAATVVLSCNPDPLPEDNAPKGPTEEELAYVDSLENALYRQVRAMQVVLTTDDLLIESCVPGQDGASVITFSTGASVAVYPDAADSYTQMFTYVEEEEQKYIVFNSNGDKVALAITEAMAEKGSDYICAHLKMQNFKEETVNVVLSGSMNVKMPNEIYLASLKEKCEAKSGRKLNFIKLEAAPVTGCINWLLEDK